MKLRNRILIASASMVAASAFAGDFSLVNNTGHAIREVYVAAADGQAWGSDQLAPDATLANNKSLSFKVGDRGTCPRAMRVVFDDDYFEVVLKPVDLCRTERLSLQYNRATMEVTARQD